MAIKTRQSNKNKIYKFSLNGDSETDDLANALQSAPTSDEASDERVIEQNREAFQEKRREAPCPLPGCSFQSGCIYRLSWGRNERNADTKTYQLVGFPLWVEEEEGSMVKEEAIEQTTAVC